MLNFIFRKKAERLAEEQRVRQEQMRQTLEIMRMKKHVGFFLNISLLVL